MAMKVTAECIACGACEPECPNTAILAEAASYLVDPDRCTECVGAYESPRCVEVCPVEEGIVRDPARLETRTELEIKYARLHA